MKHSAHVEWEYATVNVGALGGSPQSGSVKAFTTRAAPFEETEIKPTRLDTGDQSVIWNYYEEVSMLDRMGALGWELIAPPTIERQAYSFGDETVTRERYYRYYFKRRAIERTENE